MSHVMMIEDNSDLALMLVQALEMTDYSVTYCRSGREALAQLDIIDPPDVIVSDLLMPDINGEDLMAHILAQPGWERTPVIFMSAAVSRTTQDDLIKAGAYGFLTKPFPMNELFSIIANALKDSHTSWA